MVESDGRAVPSSLSSIAQALSPLFIIAVLSPGLFYLLNIFLKRMNNTPAHSQEFIESMKKALLSEKQQLEQELGQIAHKEEAGEYTATYPDYERDEEANAMEMADFESSNATTKATQARLNDVRQALDSIELGSYGVTKEGDLIPEERLKANPAATTIIKS